MEYTFCRRPDQSQLKQEFETRGSISLAAWLAKREARALADSLAKRQDWVEVFRGEEQAYDMPVSAFEALEQHQKDQIDRLVWAQAARDFQFRYRTVRVPDDRTERKPHDDELHGFAEFMCSDPVMALLRDIIGRHDISFADAQATAYSAGHFQTQHDDDVDGKNRVAAYVFSLTEGWSVDWGGHLLFPDDGAIEGFMPSFNCLRIFAVPRPHSVTFVPPFVTATRYSITGWLRTA